MFVDVCYMFASCDLRFVASFFAVFGMLFWCVSDDVRLRCLPSVVLSLEIRCVLFADC